MNRLLRCERTTIENIEFSLNYQQCAWKRNLESRSFYSQLMRSPVYYITRSKNLGSQVWNKQYKISNTKECLCKIHTSLMNVLRFHATTSTTPGAAETAVKRDTRKPRYANYVELLEVTENAANERKNRVKHLRAKKLQEFIHRTQQEVQEKNQRKEQSADLLNNQCNMNNQQIAEYKTVDHYVAIGEDFNYDNKPCIYIGANHNYSNNILNNPKKINDILKSFHNYKEHIEEEQLMEDLESTHISPFTPNQNLEGIEHSDISNSPELYVPLDSIGKNSKSKNSVSLKIAKNRNSSFKSKTYRSEEFELLSKKRAMKEGLTSYLNVCVSTGLLNRGLSTLITYRERGRTNPKFKNFINIDMYNILLHGYAAKGLYEKFHYIFKLIQEDRLNFNEQTFAAIFECLGRLESTIDNNVKIREYIEKAKSMGFSLHQIMNESKFVADQRDMVMDAILRIHANFKPTYTPPDLNYNNVLLNHLNNFVAPIKFNENPISETSSEVVKGIWDSKKGYTKDQLQKFFKEQLKIESNGYITIKSIEKCKTYANANYYRTKLDELESYWRSQITLALNRDMNNLKLQMRYRPQGFMNYYTYLKTLNSSHYVDILIKEVYKLAEGSETYSPSVGQLYKELGRKVQSRYQIEIKKKNGVLEKIDEIYNSYCDAWHNCNQNDNTRQIWQRLVHRERLSGPSMDIQDDNWPTNVLIGVGHFLYNILMRDIKIDANITRQDRKNKQNFLPAFYTLFRNQGRIVKEEVKPHPVLSRIFRASRQQTLTFESNMVPMLCPPQPWSSAYNGGYILNKTDLIRLPHQAIQQWDRIKATPTQNIYPALDSLNQLSCIPWRVNTAILDVLIKVFQDGGDHKLDVPQPPGSLPPLPSLPEKNSSMTNNERAILLKEKMLHRRKQAEMYSLWCDTLYRLSLANHYRDKVFWLPHNMDFRGRVYPVPPHLNHLGSDLARSMLIFDQAQPLGPDGFKWLKIHCINLTGLKKRSTIQERLNYAEELIPEILDSANNPLTGRMWWRTSEEPWQTLACCMEIAKVYKSSRPEEFESRFPIHQDGSCNGLQHYAALGRDKAGAISVNLTPLHLPQDVYSTVATLVEKARKEDAESGLHVAKILEGFVQRKVIKQTVMTTVYGVTRYGARLQIARQLKDIENFPKDAVWQASTYLTTKTFESLREMFTSTREIQDWFTDCARLISGVSGKNVEWVTPMGLPVVQPYNRQEYKTQWKNNLRIPEVMSSDLYEKPNTMKQKNAFPPNFIHSLDSSHMMLTSLHCERQGLTFVSVHDCFWTHPCSVSQLNRICREQFVALHSQPILKDLSQFLKNMYSFKKSEFTNNSSEDFPKEALNRLLGQLPATGDFNLQEVLKSEYFFS